MRIRGNIQKIIHLQFINKLYTHRNICTQQATVSTKTQKENHKQNQILLLHSSDNIECIAPPVSRLPLSNLHMGAFLKLYLLLHCSYPSFAYFSLSHQINRSDCFVFMFVCVHIPLNTLLIISTEKNTFSANSIRQRRRTPRPHGKVFVLREHGNLRNKERQG